MELYAHHIKNISWSSESIDGLFLSIFRSWDHFNAKNQTLHTWKNIGMQVNGTRPVLINSSHIPAPGVKLKPPYFWEILINIWNGLTREIKHPSVSHIYRSKKDWSNANNSNNMPPKLKYKTELSDNTTWNSCSAR